MIQSVALSISIQLLDNLCNITFHVKFKHGIILPSIEHLHDKYQIIL